MMINIITFSWRRAMLAFMITGTALFQACFDDDFAQTMKFETLPIIPNIQFDGSPVPGNGGIIIPGVISTTSVQLNWTRAEDAQTAQGDLQYRVYRSSSNNISTPVLAEANGTSVTGWTQDIVTAVAGGLTPGTGYYFNVVVRDGDGNSAAYVTMSVTTQSVSNELPVPGNGGIITTGVISTTSVQLNWTRAEDAQTAQGDLQYCVYRSSNNNISTPALAEANGTVVTGWTQDIVTAVANGLSPGTGYYFNVMVRDGDGNTAAYVTVSVTTQSDAIYMFSAGTYTGNLVTPVTSSTLAAVSIRDTIDSLCVYAKSSSYPSLPCLNVRAFISISTTDYIAAMPGNFSVPTNKGITGPTGIEIATNWSDLLDGSILENLKNADIAQNKWWSGSDSAGNYISSDACVACNTCSSWTDETNASQGETGIANKIDSTWIDDGSDNCDNSRHVLCVCW
jgi:hypothetical protein